MNAHVRFFDDGQSNLTIWTPERIQAEIESTRWQIRFALDALPAADMDRAKLLISKIVGLRIAAGEIDVKLKPVPVGLQ